MAYVEYCGGWLQSKVQGFPLMRNGYSKDARLPCLKKRTETPVLCFPIIQKGIKIARLLCLIY